jgi:hypothetical protein
MDGERYRDLCEDIRQNGLVNPVIIHEGLLLDGRNRVLACEYNEVKPRFVELREIYQGPMSVTQWIWSVNAQRRFTAPSHRFCRVRG